MYFLVVRRREGGAALPAASLKKIPPLRADVQIIDHHCEQLGRVSTQACVFNPTPGLDPIPRLYDVRISGMSTLGMNLSGLEEVDGVLYAQSWWCRVCP